MKARVKWVDGLMFVGEAGSGHAVVMDGAPEHGGRDLGVRPMEMLLLGLGGCTGVDVMLILRKGREKVADCAVEIAAERAETDPKIFTRIHLHYVLTGEALSSAKVERAIQLSIEKYCSATAMLAKAATITHDYEIRGRAASTPVGPVALPSPPRGERVEKP
jgi:putative redox protein